MGENESGIQNLFVFFAYLCLRRRDIIDRHFIILVSVIEWLSIFILLKRKLKNIKAKDTFFYKELKSF